MQELEADEQNFTQYFRLSPTQLNENLSLAEQDIKKWETNYKKSITMTEQLAITLR